jgi:hypothetical protein
MQLKAAPTMLSDSKAGIEASQDRKKMLIYSILAGSSFCWS